MVGPAFFRFLTELAAHNERDWFQSHKARYEADVRDPMLALIAALRPGMAKISPHILVDPRPVGGSMFRIYRDTRFSADKAPYKTHLGAQFRHTSTAGEVHGPGYYLHLGTDMCYFGCGLWRPEKELATKVRRRIVDEPEVWRKAGKALGDQERSGEKFKRVPAGFGADAPEDVKYKDFISGAHFTPADVVKPDFVDRYLGRAREAAPFMRFLCGAAGLPF